MERAILYREVLSSDIRTTSVSTSTFPSYGMALGKLQIQGFPVTLFIPDISGFSQFIDDTEITHSQHIIAELLELLIDADSLGLSVSEIEGDAILFYRFGDAPSLESVTAQAEKMFVSFHEHLQHYERDRMCDCQACSTTQGLSLKIVVHYGNIVTLDVKEFHKLLGREVIVVHRLLKNEIDSSEYLLLTDAFLDQYPDAQQALEASTSWLPFQSASTTYDVVGEVGYKYYSLTPLREKLKKLPDRPEPEKYENKISVETTVNAPLDFAYNYLTDLTQRHDWMKRVKSVEFDDSLSRVGTSHRCVLPAMALHIEIRKNTFEKGRIEYVEQITDMPMVSRANVFSTLEELEDEIVLFRVDVHYERTFMGSMMAPMLKIVMQNQFRGNIHLFKQVVEEAYSARKRIPELAGA